MLILVFILIGLLSTFTFWGSFSLSLFGDDWLAFWRYIQHLGPKSSGQWNHLTYFLTPYGSQDILMGILKTIYNFDSTKYYVTSFIYRLFASFSFYPLVLYLTKNKLAAVFSVLFFSVTTTGLDTTNWVFNMPSYITIGFFNLSLYFFIKSKDDKKPISLIISGILYYFAYIITPIRMHGSLPFIFLIELFWIMQNKNFKIVKIAALRLSLFLVIFLIIRYTGNSQGPAEEISQRLNLGFTAISIMLSGGQLNFIFNPIIMFGSMFIPDFILPDPQRNILLLLAGILILIAVVFLIIKSFHKTNVSNALFLGLSWSFLSFFFAWWWVPNTIFHTTYRYLITSAAGISILLSAIVALGKTKTQKRFLFTIFSFLVILHIISTRIYINYLNSIHGLEISKKIWSQIPRIEEIGKSKEPIIFYFEGEAGNEMIIHNIITFGFPPHIAILYNLREEDGGLPVPMTDFKEVISAVENGKTLSSYGYHPKAIPINRIYAFYLQDQDHLINITQQARQKLLEIQNRNK